MGLFKRRPSVDSGISGNMSGSSRRSSIDSTYGPSIASSVGVDDETRKSRIWNPFSKGSLPGTQEPVMSGALPETTVGETGNKPSTSKRLKEWFRRDPLPGTGQESRPFLSNASMQPSVTDVTDSERSFYDASERLPQGSPTMIGEYPSSESGQTSAPEPDGPSGVSWAHQADQSVTNATTSQPPQTTTPPGNTSMPYSATYLPPQQPTLQTATGTADTSQLPPTTTPQQSSYFPRTYAPTDRTQTYSPTNTTQTHAPRVNITAMDPDARDADNPKVRITHYQDGRFSVELPEVRAGVTEFDVQHKPDPTTGFIPLTRITITHRPLSDGAQTMITIGDGSPDTRVRDPTFTGTSAPPVSSQYSTFRPSTTATTQQFHGLPSRIQRLKSMCREDNLSQLNSAVSSAMLVRDVLRDTNSYATSRRTTEAVTDAALSIGESLQRGDWQAVRNYLTKDRALDSEIPMIMSRLSTPAPERSIMMDENGTAMQVSYWLTRDDYGKVLPQSEMNTRLHRLMTNLDDLDRPEWSAIKDASIRLAVAAGMAEKPELWRVQDIPAGHRSGISRVNSLASSLMATSQG